VCVRRRRHHEGTPQTRDRGVAADAATTQELELSAVILLLCSARTTQLCAPRARTDYNTAANASNIPLGTEAAAGVCAQTAPSARGLPLKAAIGGPATSAVLVLDPAWPPISLASVVFCLSGRAPAQYFGAHGLNNYHRASHLPSVRAAAGVHRAGTRKTRWLRLGDLRTIAIFWLHTNVLKGPYRENAQPAFACTSASARYHAVSPATQPVLMPRRFIPAARRARALLVALKKNGHSGEWIC
jgi:hypothetical protein